MMMMMMMMVGMAMLLGKSPFVGCRFLGCRLCRRCHRGRNTTTTIAAAAVEERTDTATTDIQIPTSRRMFHQNRGTIEWSLLLAPVHDHVVVVEQVAVSRAALQALRHDVHLPIERIDLIVIAAGTIEPLVAVHRIHDRIRARAFPLIVVLLHIAVRFLFLQVSQTTTAVLLLLLLLIATTTRCHHVATATVRHRRDRDRIPVLLVLRHFPVVLRLWLTATSVHVASTSVHHLLLILLLLLLLWALHCRFPPHAATRMRWRW
uniref:Secreted protein n=1 Tax=Anopheles darlingi TaxID=43151 RepID=A0A2M4D3K5_ANODA